MKLPYAVGVYRIKRSNQKSLVEIIRLSLLLIVFLKVSSTNKYQSMIP